MVGTSSGDASPRLTHLDESGAANMVDVSTKEVTSREARAEGHVRMKPETLALILSGSMSVDAARLPDDIARLDKNESFRKSCGDVPVHLAHRIREAVGEADIQTI